MSKRKNPTHKNLFRRKAVMEFVDQDYAHKLNDEEAEWLAQFNKEYYNSERGPLHTKEQQLENERRLNRLNMTKSCMDAYSFARLTGQLYNFGLMYGARQEQEDDSPVTFKRRRPEEGYVPQEPTTVVIIGKK